MLKAEGRGHEISCLLFFFGSYMAEGSINSALSSTWRKKHSLLHFQFDHMNFNALHVYSQQ